MAVGLLIAAVEIRLRRNCDRVELRNAMHAKSFSSGGTRSPRLKPAAIQWLVFGFCGISPQLHAFRATPPRLILTEVLDPHEEQSRKGLLEDLYVTIVKKKWIFLLDRMAIVGNSGLREDLRGENRAGRSLDSPNDE